jgi:carbon monoxide dehydrogenase subunit G
LTLIETVKLPASAAQAWDLLAKSGGALRLTPGLAVGEDGRGTLRIVIGGHSVTYRGYARQHVEEEGRHLTWTLSGKEVRGTGRAHAEVRARFRNDPEGGSDLRLTVLVEGRGRLGEIEEANLDRAVSSVITRFKRAVAKELGDSAPTAAPPPAAARAVAKSSSAPAPRRPAPVRVEVVPPTPAAKPPALHGIAAGAAAAAALALGVAALVFWRSRRR